MVAKDKSEKMKVIIVGGVAGGASCAARLRRLDETAEILMVERGPYVSYANCGLPYHVGGVIEKESSLLVASEQLFRAHFGIEVRTNCEAIRISAKNKTIELRNVKTGEVATERYDKLVLSPGAASVHPPLPGIDLPGIFHVRTVPDARTIREWIERGTTFLTGMFKYAGIQMVKPVRRAVVVGGGFIGLETAENLVHVGFDVTLIQKPDHVLTPLDPEIAVLVQEHIIRHGVKVVANDGVVGFKPLDGGAIEVQTGSGKTYPAEIVILAIGVRPDTTLAKTAGLDIGERGGIRVDEQMRTSDPDIFAVGDAVEIKDFGTGQWSLIALAGPANRQGRIAADVISGRDARYRGTQGTSIIGLFGGAAAWTGIGEKTLKQIGDPDYEKIYLFPNSHAGYYPGAKMLGFKIIFRKSDGRLLGAQALGLDGPAVDKRISALAAYIQMGATVYDLEEAELCYAPQFGSAKDPVNFAGMVAGNVLRGDMPVRHWDSRDGAFLLDVREPVELSVESVPDAINIPLGQLRARLVELPRDREIHVICRSAQRAYYATRILLQNGFKACNLSGGMLSRAMYALGKLNY
ncbi:MAG: FAD-dependent oxidoreductase [Desulfobacterales bacterium]|nr:FAD-dependent oxidoreductase [Desulfobacterales bacterium]